MDEQKRILTPHNCSVAEASREQMLDPRHGTGVAAADRRHLDDLTFDELDAVLGSQDPGLAHPVILIEREAPAPERDRHAVLAVRHCAVPPRGRQCREVDTAAIIGSIPSPLRPRPYAGS